MVNHDKVAVVTGAARGIGQAICRRLAEQRITVVAVDLNAPTETLSDVKRLGGSATGLVLDVADPHSVSSLHDDVRERYGRCDILVNNAGIYPFCDIADLDYQHWRKVVSANLDSQFLMAKAVLPLMKAGGWGRIVNLTSNSTGLAIPGLTHYMASKMGVISFTRALATDVASDGITVNAVGPTLTRTPGVTSAIPEELQLQVAQSQAIKKVALAADVVGTIMFLASEDSYFVTGQTIMADGGLLRR